MNRKKMMMTIGVTAMLGLATISTVDIPLIPHATAVSAVSKEYENAAQQAELVKSANLSKKAFYKTMKEELGFEKKAIDYAVKKLKIDWKENALESAKNLQKFGMSKEKIKESLLSEEDGGGFTKSQVNYALKHLEDEE